MERKKVVIVGGGITGLTAAYYLQKQTHPEMEITLLEKSEELGGKLETIRQDGYTIERGADSLLARKRPGMKLVEELGLSDHLIYNHTGQAYVLVENALHTIPAGSYMGIPIAEQPFHDSELLSSTGKNRVLEEPSIPRGKELSDQSLGHFLRRRFGDELVENLMEPLLSGIYSSDIDQMSIQSTFPYFYDLEQQYGSVLSGLHETMPAKRTGTGKKSAQFAALQEGMQEMIDELVKAIGNHSIHTGKDVQQITKNETNYVLHTADGASYEADHVLLTIPHQNVPSLFDDETPVSSLKEIPVSSVANVALAFDAEAVKSDLDGTGFVVSRNSDFRITACTWTDRKWPHTTPDGKVLLRLYTGKPNDQEIVSQSDDEIVATVLNDLRKIMTIDGEPDFSVVSRWQHVMPQYTVDHREKVEHVRYTLQNDWPGVFLAGSSYDGVGVPDCIDSAEKAVQEIVSH